MLTIIEKRAAALLECQVGHGIVQTEVVVGKEFALEMTQIIALEQAELKMLAMEKPPYTMHLRSIR